MHAGIFAGPSDDFRCQQIHNKTILVCGPNRAVPAQETCAGTFLASETKRTIKKPGSKPLETNRHFAKWTCQLLDDEINHAAADQSLANSGPGRPLRAIGKQV